MRPRAQWKTLKNGRYALTLDALREHAYFYAKHCRFRPFEVRRVLESAADPVELDQVIDEIKKGKHYGNP